MAKDIEITKKDKLKAVFFVLGAGALIWGGYGLYSYFFVNDTSADDSKSDDRQTDTVVNVTNMPSSSIIAAPQSAQLTAAAGCKEDSLQQVINGMAVELQTSNKERDEYKKTAEACAKTSQGSDSTIVNLQKQLTECGKEKVMANKSKKPAAQKKTPQKKKPCVKPAPVKKNPGVKPAPVKKKPVPAQQPAPCDCKKSAAIAVAKIIVEDKTITAVAASQAGSVNANVSAKSVVVVEVKDAAQTQPVVRTYPPAGHMSVKTTWYVTKKERGCH